ncbi:MAG TPA: CotH kinase family protein [Polyangiaceae bacterium]|nr:CotH kinase family protein [Polyangiaceae bacterium]
MHGTLVVGLIALCAAGCGSGGDGLSPSEEPGGDGVPGAEVFAAEQILEVRLSLAAADWERLEEQGNEEVFLRGSGQVSGSALSERRFASLGVRHKGAYTLHHCWENFGGVRSHVGACAKLSYKLKFSEYDEAARLDGLKRLNLHAASGDATKLRELIAYSTFNEFGVDAPRATPAKLYINDVYQGIFIAVEEVDGRYTKAHFPEGPNGNLYKEVWPRAEAPASRYVAALETNEDIADVSAMLNFASAIADASSSTFSEDMERWIDLDTLLRYVAVDRALKNWDGIMAFYSPLSPHNFYWYQDDGADGRFHLIPWDLDNTLWEFDPYMQPQDWVTAAPVPDWNAKPLSCEARQIWSSQSPLRLMPPRCDPFLDLLAETHWERFESLSAELLAGPFSTGRLNEKVSYWQSRIAPLVKDDPVVNFTSWQNEVRRFPQILARAVEDFGSFVEAGLVQETSNVEPTPELPPELVDAVTPDQGLLVDAVTNFELEVAPAGAPAGVYVSGDPFALVSATWNQMDPLSGSADLRFDFTFKRAPGSYDEWVMLGLDAPLPMDIRARRAITVTLSSDRARVVRVRLASPAYETAFGGVWSEFGAEVSVTSAPKTVSIPLRSLAYPSWARLQWSVGAGWTGSDQTALQTVLEQCTGLIFAPGATFGSDGELTEEVEVGHLQIDNVYLQ